MFKCKRRTNTRPRHRTPYRALYALLEGQAKVTNMAEEMLGVVDYPVLDGKHF